MPVAPIEPQELSMFPQSLENWKTDGSCLQQQVGTGLTTILAWESLRTLTVLCMCYMYSRQQFIAIPIRIQR